MMMILKHLIYLVHIINLKFSFYVILIIPSFEPHDIWDESFEYDITVISFDNPYCLYMYDSLFHSHTINWLLYLLPNESQFPFLFIDNDVIFDSLIFKFGLFENEFKEYTEKESSW